jgi:hypothetical protein
MEETRRKPTSIGALRSVQIRPTTTGQPSRREWLFLHEGQFAPPS